MSYESNITGAQHFFAGEDKILSYEVFATGSTTVMENVATFSLKWELRVGSNPTKATGNLVLTKTSSVGGGITITGTFNSARAVNTQRVIVTITDTDTEELTAGKYVCALKRMDTGLEAVLSHGLVDLLVAAVY